MNILFYNSKVIGNIGNIVVAGRKILKFMRLICKE